MSDRGNNRQEFPELGFCLLPGDAQDSSDSVAELEHIGTLLPVEWLAAMATGTPAECAAAVKRQIDLGGDAVLMHGATPAGLAPVVDAYRQLVA